jgi:hypothetical protein
MNIYKSFSINGVNIDDFPFERELFMEAYLVENTKALMLQTDDDVQILGYEVPISGGTMKGDGRADIVALYGDDTIAIIELKLRTAGKDAQEQLSGYLNKKQREFVFNSVSADNADIFAGKSIDDYYWKGILVAENIDQCIVDTIESDCNVLGNEHLELCAISLQRFIDRDTRQVYVLNKAFSKPTTARDYQKISVNGKLLNKRQAVLEVLKMYVSKHPSAGYEDMKKVFPDSLQGSNGVITDVSSVGDSVRYFMDDEIKLADGTIIVVCNQWGKNKQGHLPGNIERFMEQANKLGIAMTYAK